MNVIDSLIEKIVQMRNPTVIGLDPDLHKIPAFYKQEINFCQDPREAVAKIILDFNRDIIDTVAPYVPAVKPQMAFYEMYGYHGVKVFEDTVAYAKSRGLVVIEDAKRGDIGNTAMAYAEGHLGTVALPGGSRIPSFDADFLTVNPFLGSESLVPFVKMCAENQKGIFILVKTSNISSGEIQDVVTEDGMTVSEKIANYVAEQAKSPVGQYGYSSIGAVVGATYPGEAETLRRIMPNSYFLVPGYGAQGGGATDVLPCFNSDGFGAIVNSSRGILYSHMTDEERNICTRDAYLASVKAEAIRMQQNLYTALRTAYPNMLY